MEDLLQQINLWLLSLTGGSASLTDLPSLSELTGGSSLAVVLGVIWYFARAIRRIVSLLLMVVVLYFALRLGCGIDLLDSARGI